MVAAQSNVRSGDLMDRTDVEKLLRSFYEQVFRDDTLAEPFAEIRERGLDTHLPVMCDFWETVLFRAGLYRRSALEAHRRVHAKIPLTAQHFVRWLALWETTIDQMYCGPAATTAKVQATRIAISLYRRIAGGVESELDGIAVEPIKTPQRGLRRNLQGGGDGEQTGERTADL